MVVGEIASWQSWGFCRTCNRLVHVDDDGIIAAHKIGPWGTGVDCDGNGTKEGENPDEAA